MNKFHSEWAKYIGRCEVDVKNFNCCISIIVRYSLWRNLLKNLFFFSFLWTEEERIVTQCRLDTHNQRMEKFSHRNENTALKHKKRNITEKQQSLRTEPFVYAYWHKDRPLFFLSPRVHIAAAAAHIHEHRHPANTISVGLHSGYMCVFKPLWLSTLHCVLSLFVVIAADVVFAVFILPSTLSTCHS